MPEINYKIQWPDGSQQNCYSPSLVIKKYFNPGETYKLAEFVAKSRTVLNYFNNLSQLSNFFSRAPTS